MPVVINEFEVLPAAEPSQESGSETAAEKPPATPTGPTLQEIERALRRTWERAMRLRAH